MTIYNLIYKITEIKQQQLYQGFRFYMDVFYYNIKICLHVDISTGDIIIPKFIIYNYPYMFENDYIEVLAYNNETIIAEKLQSILFLKFKNSIMKDYYDIYYMIQYLNDSFNYVDLKIEILLMIY